MSISLDLVVGHAADPSLWHAIVSDPKNLLPAIGTLVTVIGVVISVATFAITQAVQRKVERAKAIQELVGWFSKRRAEDPLIKSVAHDLVYGPSPTLTAGDLGSDKETGVARLLSSLNHIGFYVDLGLVSAKDVARTEAGYYFMAALRNADILGYLQHVDRNDEQMAGQKNQSFYYLRRHGSKIARLQSAKLPDTPLRPRATAAARPPTVAAAAPTAP